ncbi:MAG TPA: hypothetical protein VN824_12795, partial [Puia sp.]|nr:hypothetical protein [Puia sp.]
MSTNIENNEWSDAAGLEQLANELFKAPPGGFFPAAVLPVGVPPAAAHPGGVSPAAAQRKESFDINDPQSSLPDPHFEDGKVPVAVAGSGRQPSLREAPASSSSHDVLSRITSFSVTPQIPFAGAGESP